MENQTLALSIVKQTIEPKPAVRDRDEIGRPLFYRIPKVGQIKHCSRAINYCPLIYC